MDPEEKPEKKEPSDEAADRPRRKKKKKKAAALKGRPASALARPADGSAPKPGGGGKGLVLIAAALALLIGVGVGWLVRGSRGGDVGATPDPATMSSSAAAAAASGGPCAAWSTTICEQAGAQSEACGQAKSASDLLGPEACNKALAEVPATLEKLKTARGACDQLVQKLCADLGPQTETCKMVKERTPQFPPGRCKEMLDGYDKVIGELKQMEKRNAPISAADAAKQRAGDGPSFGPADAKVAIVEYSDFECPFCSKAAETVTKLKEKYGNTVRFVFRQYPLPMHPNAALAAEAALAAHAQKKFWKYHDLMFANQKALDRASLEKYATEAGLDSAAFKKALDDHTYAEAVKADQKLGEELGVSGTPTMIVGTKRVA
ncbi:MAG TPA: thioredoxin domain-containing protein, partial [Polyangiaceae bacterium]|nr:thioredoxin domain-containing protein [Polyangiaceae bacterium]